MLFLLLHLYQKIHKKNFNADVIRWCEEQNKSLQVMVLLLVQRQR